MLLNAGNGADEEQVENSLAEVAVGGLSDQLWSGAEDAHDADVAQVAQAGRRGKKRDRGGVGSRLSEDEGVLCETSNVVVDLGGGERSVEGVSTALPFGLELDALLRIHPKISAPWEGREPGRRCDGRQKALSYATLISSTPHLYFAFPP